jgi:hypothetical protein
MADEPKRLDIPFTLPSYRDGCRELAIWAVVAWIALSLLLRW